MPNKLFIMLCGAYSSFIYQTTLMHSFVSAYCSIEEVRVWWRIDEEKRDAEVLFLFVLNFLPYPLAASVVLNGTHLLLLLLWT